MYFSGAIQLSLDSLAFLCLSDVGFQIHGHGIDGIRQCFYFVSGFDGKPRVQVSCGDFFHSLRKLQHGVHKFARYLAADQKEGCEDEEKQCSHAEKRFFENARHGSGKTFADPFYRFPGSGRRRQSRFFVREDSAAVFHVGNREKDEVILGAVHSHHTVAAFAFCHFPRYLSKIFLRTFP